MPLSERLQSYLQNPDLSLYLVFAGFVAFRGHFFFIAIALAIWLISQPTIKTKDCYLKSNGFFENDSLFHFYMFAIGLIIPSILFVLFYLVSDFQFMGVGSQWLASIAIFPDTYDQCLVGDHTGLKDKVLAKIEKHWRSLVAGQYVRWMGFLFSAFWIAIIFADIQCVVRVSAASQKTSMLLLVLAIIVLLFFIVFYTIEPRVSRSPCEYNFTFFGRRIISVFAPLFLGGILIFLAVYICTRFNKASEQPLQ